MVLFVLPSEDGANGKTLPRQEDKRLADILTNAVAKDCGEEVADIPGVIGIKVVLEC